MIYALALIGAASIGRWIWRHRNDGSALLGVLQPRGYWIYAGSTGPEKEKR